MTILKLNEDIFISLSRVLNVTYEVLQTNHVIEEEPNNVYGLKVYYNDDSVSTYETSYSILDISTNKDFVIDLAVKLATNQVLPVHTKDVIEDFLDN